MIKPGTLISLKPFLQVPGKELDIYMVLDVEPDPGDIQYYSLRYKVLSPNATIEYISYSAIFWYEAIA